MAFRKGAKPSQPDKLARTKPALEHAVIRAALAAPLPPSADLVRWDVRRGNQGDFSACTCFATCGAVAVSLGAAGVPGFLGSQHCLYSDSGLLEGGELSDDGRELADVMACLSGGLVPYEGDDAAPEFCDLTPANVNATTTLAELKLQITHVTGEHTVDLTAPNAIDVVCAALSGSPPAEVVIAAYVGPLFENATPRDVIDREIPTNPPDPNAGWHALRVSGYRTNASGKREFKLTNSWGYGWCASGCVWVSEGFILGCSEAWPMTCVPKIAKPDTLPALPDADATAPHEAQP